MAKITKEPYAFRKDLFGLLFQEGTHQEALDFAKGFTPTAEIQSGWIKNDWGHTPIQSHADGKGGVFVNATFTEGDRAYYYNLIGHEATDLLLRHHNVRKV